MDLSHLHYKIQKILLYLIIYYSILFYSILFYLMTVNLVQWRAALGIFNCRSLVMSHHVCNLTKNFVSMFQVSSFATLLALFCKCFYFLLTLVYMFVVLQCHGDNEPNPGPRKLKTNIFLVCH